MSFRKLSDTSKDYFTYSSLDSESRRDSWRQRGSFSFSSNNYESEKIVKSSYFTYSQPTKTVAGFEEEVRKKRRGLLSMSRGTKSMEDNENGFTKMVSALPPSRLALNNGQLDEVFQDISQITTNLYLSGIYAVTSDKLRFYGIRFVVSVMRDFSIGSVTAAIATANQNPSNSSNCNNNVNGNSTGNSIIDSSSNSSNSNTNSSSSSSSTSSKSTCSTMNHNQFITYITIPVDDSESTDLISLFPDILPQIHSYCTRGHNVLVHCAAGVSRSATVVIGYLMKYRGMTLSQAFSLVRSRRSCVQPNSSFWSQLIRYEALVSNSNS